MPHLRGLLKGVSQLEHAEIVLMAAFAGNLLLQTEVWWPMKEKGLQ
ncbi:MAG: hypothetical protein V3S24_12525 [Candidatus Tectomicrobia bacterium]